jgi:hypothetical protein
VKLYIAGPMRGYPRYNFDAFDEAQWTLEDAGHEVISPAQLDRDLGFDPDKTLEEQGFSVEEAMRRDVHAILEVDGVALLPGWEQSQGARTERTVAQALGLAIYEFDPEYPDALPVVVPDDHETHLRLNREEAMRRHPSSQNFPTPLDMAGALLGVKEGRKAGAAVEHEALLEAYREGLSLHELKRRNAEARRQGAAVEQEARKEWTPQQVTSILGAKPRPARIGSDTTNPKDLLGVKKPQLWLVPRSFIIRVAQAMADGAAKYNPYNWREKAVRATVYSSAADRHLAAWLDGEDHATDSGYHHLAHAAACLAILIDAIETGNLVDDRPTPGAAGRLIAELTES